MPESLLLGRSEVAAVRHNSRRNRSGQLTEHTQAVRDNVAFDIEQAILKADQKLLTGETEKTPVAVIAQ